MEMAAMQLYQMVYISCQSIGMQLGPPSTPPTTPLSSGLADPADILLKPIVSDINLGGDVAKGSYAGSLWLYSRRRTQVQIFQTTEDSDT
jgi:hypothetical protein